MDLSIRRVIAVRDEIHRELSLFTMHNADLASVV